MASGETLLVWSPLAAEFPASLAAVPAVRNNHPVLEFDGATSWLCYFSGFMPRTYAGGGITITLVWMAKTATSGGVTWGTSIERFTTDLDSDSFAAEQTGTGSANGTSGITTVTTTAHTNSQIDGVAAGEAFRLQLARKTADGGDTMSSDFAQLLMVEMRET